MTTKQEDGEVNECFDRSQELVKTIESILANQGRLVQGAVLVDLVAIWLARHHPDVRRETLKQFVGALVKLIVVNEKIFFGDNGFPKTGLN
jgi:hypothetical protein